MPARLGGESSTASRAVSITAATAGEEAARTPGVLEDLGDEAASEDQVGLVENHGLARRDGALRLFEVRPEAPPRKRLDAGGRALVGGADAGDGLDRGRR